MPLEALISIKFDESVTSREEVYEALTELRRESLGNTMIFVHNIQDVEVKDAKSETHPQIPKG